MKLKLNHKGIEWLLKEGARGDIERRTSNIEAAAGEGMEGSVEVGRTRVRGSVITATYEAMQAEARGRALTRAIDAGRR